MGFVGDAVRDGAAGMGKRLQGQCVNLCVGIDIFHSPPWKM